MNHLIIEKSSSSFFSSCGDSIPSEPRKNAMIRTEAADASERYQWRYLRWGFRIIQVVAGVYIVVQLIQVLLR